jgi:hypothetical protein
MSFLVTFVNELQILTPLPTTGSPIDLVDVLKTIVLPTVGGGVAFLGNKIWQLQVKKIEEVRERENREHTYRMRALELSPLKDSISCQIESKASSSRDFIGTVIVDPNNYEYAIAQYQKMISVVSSDLEEIENLAASLRRTDFTQFRDSK